MMLLPLFGFALTIWQMADWDRFAALAESTIPREGRVQLLYEIVDPPDVYARELVGFDYEQGGFIRVHGGNALGLSSAGRQFAGRLSTGCAWLDPPQAYAPSTLNPTALKPAPIEILRLVLQRPELVLELRPRDDGGFQFEMEVFQGVPGVTEAGIAESAVIRREQWSIEVGPDGRVHQRTAPTTIKYEYGHDHWPIAFERIGPTGMRRYELVSVGELAPNALSPEGAMVILSSVETQRVRQPSAALDAASGIGDVPETYEQDPSRRWSLALILGGVLVLVLGGGVLVRKRYAPA